MKKSQKVIFAVVCVGLLFACSKTEWVKSKNVTVAWEEPTTLGHGTPISKDLALRYNVYIDRDTDKTHEDAELLTAEPIAETSYTISSIEHKGKYFIGVQALYCRVKDGELYGESSIAWSSNKADTAGRKFGIKIK